MAEDGDSWKLVLPCTRAEGENIAQMDIPEDVPGWPVLLTTEPDPDHPDNWQLEAYFDAPPSGDLLAKVVALAPSAAAILPQVEHLPAQDWVTLSQAGLEPVQAGRFFVHTPVYRHMIPEGVIPFEIDAGLAFGTGQHETTSGCLWLLDHLALRSTEIRNLVDLGTGTGILAFAALALWPEARAIATDIDPIAVDVTRDNAQINHVAMGTGTGELELVAADGMEHRSLSMRAPFDLVIANILAGPLIEMAGSICASVRPDGHVILAGLLTTQAEKVRKSYQAHGLLTELAIERGDWTCLLLQKRTE